MTKKTTLIIAGVSILVGYFIFLYAFPAPKTKTNFKPTSANKAFGKYPDVKFF